MLKVLGDDWDVQWRLIGRRQMRYHRECCGASCECCKIDLQNSTSLVLHKHFGNIVFLRNYRLHEVLVEFGLQSQFPRDFPKIEPITSQPAHELLTYFHSAQASKGAQSALGLLVVSQASTRRRGGDDTAG